LPSSISGSYELVKNFCRCAGASPQRTITTIL
jgi:hypothetical protein